MDEMALFLAFEVDQHCAPAASEIEEDSLFKAIDAFVSDSDLDFGEVQCTLQMSVLRDLWDNLIRMWRRLCDLPNVNGKDPASGIATGGPNLEMAASGSGPPPPPPPPVRKY